MTTINTSIIKALVEHVGGDSSGIPDGTIGGKTYTAGNAIDLTDNTISVKYDADTMELKNGKLAAKSGTGNGLEYLEDATWSGSSFRVPKTDKLTNAVLVAKLYNKTKQKYDYAILVLDTTISSVKYKAYWTAYNQTTNDIMLSYNKTTNQYSVTLHVFTSTDYNPPSKEAGTGLFKLTGWSPEVMFALFTILTCDSFI